MFLRTIIAGFRGNRRNLTRGAIPPKGDSMSFAFYITTKYWKKHKKNLAALIFSASLMTAVVLAFWLGEREKTSRVLDSIYSTGGYLDLAVANASDELRAEIVSGNSAGAFRQFSAAEQHRLYKLCVLHLSAVAPRCVIWTAPTWENTRSP